MCKVTASSSLRLRQQGVTLIELMVALVISMLLAIGVMLVQRNLALQKSRGTDVSLQIGRAHV